MNISDSLLELAENRLAAVLPTLTPEQLVGAYHLANLLPAGLETLWEQVDGHMEKRGMPRPEMHPAMTDSLRTPNERVGTPEAPLANGCEAGTSTCVCDIGS